MKKIYSLLVGLAAVLTASALTPGQGKFAHKINTPEGLNAPKASMLIPKKAIETPRLAEQVTSRGVEELITNPEGTSVDYLLKATRFQYGMWGLDYLYGEFSGNIVWGEDGIVYIRDIISGWPSGIYVEGVLEDGKVTVTLPQICYEEEGEYFYASKMQLYTYMEDGERFLGYRNVADDDNYLVYEMGEDGSLTLKLNDGDPQSEELPDYIVGICGDPSEGVDDWYGFGDSYQTYEEFSEEPVTVPEGVEMNDWVMTASNINLIVKVGFDGDDVYISDCSDFIEGITFKGTIDGDVVRFPVDQYLGQFEGYFLYLEAVEWADETWEEFIPIEDEIVMTYDAEKMRIAVDNPLIDIMYCTSKTKDPEFYEPMEYFENPTFIFQNADDMNAAPEDPYVAYYAPYEYRPWYDCYEGYIEWMIPCVNVNGYLLDTNNMYYHFLVNGEVMTFTLEEYPYFDEEVTDVPYDFGDDFDLQVFDESHYFTFKSDEFKTFGLQSFFVGTDGVTYTSNLVTYDPDPSALDSLNSAKEVKTVEFYNIQGQLVSQPTEGIYIMRTVCTDGTSSVRKIIKK